MAKFKQEKDVVTKQPTRSVAFVIDLTPDGNLGIDRVILEDDTVSSREQFAERDQADIVLMKLSRHIRHARLTGEQL